MSKNLTCSSVPYSPTSPPLPSSNIQYNDNSMLFPDDDEYYNLVETMLENSINFVGIVVDQSQNDKGIFANYVIL